jgi:hypothetical protein
MIEFLHWISILLEFCTALLALRLVLHHKKYAWGLLLTFSIYVFYDLAKYLSFAISSDALYILFFIASASAFWAVWQMGKGKK